MDVLTVSVVLLWLGRHVVKVTATADGQAELWVDDAHLPTSAIERTAAVLREAPSEGAPASQHLVPPPGEDRAAGGFDFAPDTGRPTPHAAAAVSPAAAPRSGM